MSADATTGIVVEGLGVSRYRRRRPEQTLLYRIVAQHYPALVEHLADQDKTLPAHLQQEFEDYLRCGRLEHGFPRVRCELDGLFGAADDGAASKEDAAKSELDKLFGGKPK